MLKAEETDLLSQLTAGWGCCNVGRFFIRPRQYFLYTYRARMVRKRWREKIFVHTSWQKFWFGSSTIFSQQCCCEATEFKCQAVKNSVFSSQSSSGASFPRRISVAHPAGSDVQPCTQLSLSRRRWCHTEGPPLAGALQNLSREASTVPVAVPPAALGRVSQSERLLVMNRTHTHTQRAHAGSQR